MDEETIIKQTIRISVVQVFMNMISFSVAILCCYFVAQHVHDKNYGFAAFNFFAALLNFLMIARFPGIVKKNNLNK